MKGAKRDIFQFLGVAVDDFAGRLRLSDGPAENIEIGQRGRAFDEIALGRRVGFVLSQKDRPEILGVVQSEVQIGKGQRPDRSLSLVYDQSSQNEGIGILVGLIEGHLAIEMSRAQSGIAKEAVISHVGRGTEAAPPNTEGLLGETLFARISRAKPAGNKFEMPLHPLAPGTPRAIRDRP